MESNSIIVPTNLREAVAFYADPLNCHDLMVAVRWPSEVCCPRCGDLNVTLFKTRPLFKCNGCKKQFTTKVGTIFEDSPLPLAKWLPAVWLIVNCKNGISSCELARDLEVCQKTAWFMLHRIREAMRTGTFEKASGPVEADETYIGGLEKNKHSDRRIKGTQGRSAAGKTVVMGVLERGTESRKSKVRAGLIANASGANLKAVIRREVAEFATVYTDAWKGYNGLSDEYIHEFIDHTVMYALGQIHTNGIENFWSLLKRALKGTYVSVEPFHLSRYIDEEVFRFNHRGNTDRERFLTTMSTVAGRRLTYEALTSEYEVYYQQMYA